MIVYRISLRHIITTAYLPTTLGPKVSIDFTRTSSIKLSFTCVSITVHEIIQKQRIFSASTSQPTCSRTLSTNATYRFLVAKSCDLNNESERRSVSIACSAFAIATCLQTLLLELHEQEKAARDNLTHL